MAGKVQHRVIGPGLIAVRIDDHGFGVVGHDQFGAAAVKTQGLCGGAQPVGGGFTGRGIGEGVARSAHGRDEDVGSAAVCQTDCGASVVDEHLLTGAVDLAHGAFEGFGETAVVLAELGVAVDGRIGVLLAVFLPQQHQGHAFAPQLLVQVCIVGGQKAAGTLRCAHQTGVQHRLVHGLDLRPMQTCGAGQLDVFGDDAFGDAQCAGDVLVRVLEFKFETQDVSDVTHSDPSGIGHVGSSKKLKKASPSGLEKYAQHLHAACSISRASTSVTTNRNQRSR